MKFHLVMLAVTAMVFAPVLQAQVLAASTLKEVNLSEAAKNTAKEIVQEDGPRLPMPCAWTSAPPEGFYILNFEDYPEPPNGLRGRRDAPVDLSGYSWSEIRGTFPMYLGEGSPDELMTSLGYELVTLLEDQRVLMLNGYCQRAWVLLPAGSEVWIHEETGAIGAARGCVNVTLTGYGRPHFRADVDEKHPPKVPLDEFLMEEVEPEATVVQEATQKEEDDDGISPWWFLLGGVPFLFLLGGDDDQDRGCLPGTFLTQLGECKENFENEGDRRSFSISISLQTGGS